MITVAATNVNRILTGADPLRFTGRTKVALGIAISYYMGIGRNYAWVKRLKSNNGMTDTLEKCKTTLVAIRRSNRWMTGEGD